ncbi:sugar ABC transporter ATP-binding protein [Microbacterium caowuchunii]|uniref:Sugar ABC transporter ATP-binding protein n=1 Tax=Microbacterium caowuchunii TaxID=2614638 RepID=A0A5N0TCB7_9MICO|nr:sugar ABC transporter ATP-binding protein [Microbacterium caowuchunii]KAA9132391.1 sugar ABC transporter ATP-binding protein [Microbacterium caowuchunii]
MSVLPPQAAASADREIAVRISNVSRSFGPVKALEDVSFDITAGEVTALLGENGAGKSTLLKILAGLQPPSGGSISVFGEQIASYDPNTVLTRHSVAIVPQELSLLPDRTVAENILVGIEPGSRLFPAKRQMLETARRLLAELDLDIDPSVSVRGLDLAVQQLVVVARAVARGCRVLILDEPTAMLTPAEADRLFALMSRLKAAGTTMVYVSHRMPEVFALCDRLEVLRDGRHVGSWRRDEVTPDAAVAAMVGRELGHFAGRTENPTVRDAPAALVVDRLSGRRHTDVSFDVRPGEILGVAGLPDSGRVELLANIFGAESASGGSVIVHGEDYADRSPIASVGRRLGFLPGERRAQGILTTMSVAENVGVLTTRAYSRFGLISRRGFDKNAAELGRKLRVKTGSMSQPITSLSGGNQQKALLGRWLAVDPQVLMLDEPTRGVDVGAKVEIYEELFAISAKGVAIVCSSSDLPELLTVTDRIVVMCQGRVAGVLPTATATEESIMALATGVVPSAA